MTTRVLASEKVTTELQEKVHEENNRMAYIDHLRIFLTALVIVFHTAITYGAFGDWTYIDPRADDLLTNVILTFFVMDCQSFFMGFFFFLAGYFTPGSFDRKGPGRFWKDRLLHIGLPMILYVFFLSRVPNYIDDYANNGLTLTFWEFSKNTFISQADQGPAWFLFVLLVFALGYTLVRYILTKVLHFNLEKLARIPAPTTPAMIAFGLLLAVCMFAIAQVLAIPSTFQVIGLFNLLLAFFPSYIMLFTFGVIAYRSGWLSKLPADLLKFWGPFSLALVIALPVFMFSTGAMEYGLDIYLGGDNWRCAVSCLWIGMACISFSLSLFLFVREKYSKMIKVPLFKGVNTFGAYLLHPLVIVPLAYLMSFTDYHPMIKFALVSISGVILSFCAAAILRKIPLIKEIL
jgi:hypothetical protein